MALGAPGRRTGEHRLDSAQQLGGIGQAPRAPLALGGKPAGARIEDGDPPGTQRLDVGPRRGAVPHGVVHGRGHHERAARGQGGAGQQVVGQPVGELGQRVGRGRRDEVGVGVAHQFQVADRIVMGGRLAGEGAAGGIVLELVHEDRRTGQRREGGRADEALRGRRLHGPHAVPGRGGQAHKLQRLVGGDPAADAEQDPGHVVGSRGRATAART